VLELHDLFNDYASSLKQDWDQKPSHFCRDNSGEMYDEIMNSKNIYIFVAEEKNKLIGFIEVQKISKLRKAKYNGVIERLFVKEIYRRKGIASKLMKAVIDWTEKNHLVDLRLYSGYDYKIAHAFYEKLGFVDAGKTYKLVIF